MRRRADSPHGPVAQESQPPSKRHRPSTSPTRSSSPDSTGRARIRNNNSSSQASATSPRIIRTTSPSRPVLPPLHPLPLMSSGGSGSAPSSATGDRGYQSFTSAGNATASSSSQQSKPAPGSWAPNWPPGHMTRHSIDTPHVMVKSASSSPDRGRRSGGAGDRGGDDRERASESSTTTAATGGPDIVFTRDVTNRQPRSMMACTRCRRQKMKCDGPGKQPCRGCRQAGVTCLFESRARPKSISTLPSRGSPFFSGALPPGRGGTPGAGPGPGGPSFYPPSVQAAPPITSRPVLIPDYGSRQVREPMPPPPAGSMTALAGTPYPPPLRTHSPPIHTPTGGPPPGYYPPPPPGGPYSAGAPGGMGPQSAGPTMDSRIDSRLRSLESSFRSVSTLPAAVTGIQATLGSILRAQEALATQISGGGNAPGGPRPLLMTAPPRTGGTDVPEHIWEAYRVGAWPLTPWLPGMSHMPGLPGLVLSALGRRTSVDRPDWSRRDVDQAIDAVINEVSQLLAARIPWTRDEVLGLGVFATWTSDPALGCLATGVARDLRLDRPHTLRKSHEEWREWIYVVLADHMLHLPDFTAPIVQEPVAQRWRELITSPPQPDPTTYDRDIKLLAWLEFSEVLIEIQNMQRAVRLQGEGVSLNSPVERMGSDSDRGDPSRPNSGPMTNDPTTDRDRSLTRDIWRRNASRLEAWAGGCGARHDPVLSLHFNYAILYAASPVFTANDRIWNALSSTQEGCQQLERGRDAAFAVLQSLASPDIARTLTYSFPVVRPFFGLAIAHLVGMASMIHSPIISIQHVQSVLHNVVDSLSAAAPFDLIPRLGPTATMHSPTSGPPSGRPSSGGGRPRPLPPSLLLEIVETGALVEVGKREIVGAEPDRELWRRLIG